VKQFYCKLFGCDAGKFPCCDRCHTDLYDPGFVDIGKLTPMVWFIRRHTRQVRRVLFGRRCDECKRRFRRGYNESVCSEKCFDNWLPF